MTSATNPTDLKLMQLPDADAAIGLAVRFMLGQPAYRTGDWAGVVCNQVGRGHYAFVTDAANEVVGYAGWAMTPEAKAEAWAEHGVELTDAECREGDCLIMNAWIAKNPAVHRFLVDAVRAGALDKKAIYFRRAYADGRQRVVRMPVNEFFARHLERNALAAPDPGAPGAPAQCR